MHSQVMSYTQPVKLGQILSDEPKVMGCFRFQIIVHPHLGDPLGGDQCPSSTMDQQHGSALLIHSHLEVFFSLMVVVAFLSCNPLIPGIRVLGAGISPGNHSSPPPMGRTGPSSHSPCRSPPAPGTWPLFAH